jgi:hypothetical protein
MFVPTRAVESCPVIMLGQSRTIGLFVATIARFLRLPTKAWQIKIVAIGL